MTVRPYISSILWSAAAIAAVAFGLAYAALVGDLERAMQRVAHGSRVADTQCGPIEYAEMGVASNGPGLRFDGLIPENYLHVFSRALPWLIVARLVTFAPFRLYEGLWRYAGVWDLRNIIIGVVASSGVFYQLALWRLSDLGYPRSILVIDSVLLPPG